MSLDESLQETKRGYEIFLISSHQRVLNSFFASEILSILQK
jgi:hypothetical protein